MADNGLSRPIAPLWRTLRNTVLYLGMVSVPAGPAAAGEPAGRFAPTFSEGKPVPQVLGIWRSRGYGWIIQLRPEGISVYHVSRAGCSADPRTANFVDQFAYRIVGQQAKQLVLVSAPSENRYVFRRLPGLPEACRSDNWTPRCLFDHFAASYRENYAFFRQHRIDWETRVRTHRPMVADAMSPRMLFAIFSDMLDGLGDGHVALNATVGGDPLVFRTGRGKTFQRLADRAEVERQPYADIRSAWLANYDRGVREEVLSGNFSQVSDGRVIWGRIGNLGYINFKAVDDFVPGTVDDNLQFVNSLMDRILGQFEGVAAIIMDVTANLGGYDRIARGIAGHFATQKMLAYTKRPYGAEDLVDSFFVEPSSGRRFTGPTYVVTSDITASGGEILAMTMRVLPNVTHVGTPTRGALSDRLTKVLPNGWEFNISNEIYLDPQGRLFEAIGVPPEKDLDIFPESKVEGHARAILSLVEEIRSRG